MDIAKDTYISNFFAVVSDNASNIIKMMKNLKHVLWHSSCIILTGNLLAKDVQDTSLISDVSDILKYFKQPDLERKF